MSKTFFPFDYKLIPATSPPHPPNTEYKISVGLEDWNGRHIPVVKIQMVYNGVVEGRKSPSYPVDTDDYERVHKALQEFLKEAGIRKE